MNLHLRGKRAWAAAFALVLLVNAIVLGGAAYNRSAEEARLVLSERELEVPFRWDRESENSGLALRLNWRTPVPCEDACGDLADLGIDVARISWSPIWLDEAKLLELGFPLQSEDAKTRRWPRAVSREVWLVLEFDGPEHQRAIRMAELDLQSHRLRSEQLPADEERQLAFKAARERLQKERMTRSRLFAIDAGLDAEALRAAYPQRDRHLILRARIRPDSRYYGPNHPRNTAFSGRIESLSISSVHVPLQFRDVFEGARPINYSDRPDVHYTVSLAYGRRHEPWIVDARRTEGRVVSASLRLQADKAPPKSEPQGAADE
jgi:hypothetical protein